MPLSSLCASTPAMSDDVLGKPQAACLRLQAIQSVFFRLDWSPLFCPAGFPSAQGPGVVSSNVQEHCWCHLHLPPEGACGRLRPAEPACCNWRREQMHRPRQSCGGKGTERYSLKMRVLQPLLSRGECTDPCLDRLLLFFSGLTSKKDLLSTT